MVDDRRTTVRREDDRSATDHDMLVTLCAEVRHLEEVVALLVTRLEFGPVKLIAFGLVGLLLSGVVAAILALVLSVRMR